jgi:hypothetical protein
MVVDYQNGKIYKLWSPSQNLVYIGSTTQKLSMRKAKHVASFNFWQNGKSNFVTSFLVLEFEDHRIDLIENYPCSSKEELLAREGCHIKELDCVNKHIPGRTKKEYLKENKEKIKEKQKEYYEKNKEKFSKTSKQYREEHKEELAKKKKEWRQNNKEKILEKEKIKITCDCGSTVAKSKISRHVKTKKHIYFVKNGKLPEVKGEKITCECNSIVRKRDLSTHKKTLKHLTFIESQKEYVKIIFA